VLLIWVLLVCSFFSIFWLQWQRKQQKQTEKKDTETRKAKLSETRFLEHHSSGEEADHQEGTDEGCKQHLKWLLASQVNQRNDCLHGECGKAHGWLGREAP